MYHTVLLRVMLIVAVASARHIFEIKEEQLGEHIPEYSINQNEHIPEDSFSQNEHEPEHSFSQHEHAPDHFFSQQEHYPEPTFSQPEDVPEHSFSQHEHSLKHLGPARSYQNFNLYVGHQEVVKIPIVHHHDHHNLQELHGFSSISSGNH